MVQYPLRKVKFTPENIKHLSSGKGTRIDPHQIDVKDGHRIYVNAAQNHWLNKSKAAGLPIHLPPMNNKQLVHNLKGGSVFSQIIDSISDQTKSNITNSATSYAKSQSDALLDKLKAIGSEKGLPKITKALVDKAAKPLLDKLIKAGVSTVAKKVFGHGMGKNGCGFPRCKNGSKCGKAVATTTQNLYPANQKPI